MLVTQLLHWTPSSVPDAASKNDSYSELIWLFTEENGKCLSGSTGQLAIRPVGLFSVVLKLFTP